MFRAIFAHPRERKTVITACGVVLRLLSVGGLHTEHIVRVATLQASDRQQSGDIIPHAVITVLRSRGWAQNYPKYVELI